MTESDEFSFTKNPVAEAISPGQAPIGTAAARNPGDQSKDETFEQSFLELRAINRRCQAMLYETTKIHPYLTNNDLVNAGDTQRITALAQMLSNDVAQLSQELHTIEKRLPLDQGSQAIQEYDHMVLLSIGDEYNNWQDRFIGNVIPTFQELKVLLQEAAETLNENVDLPNNPNTSS